MAGNRSAYRSIYPNVLYHTSEDWERLIAETTDPGQRDWTKRLASDCELLRNGVDLPRWRPEPLLSMAKKDTEAFCQARLARGQEIASITSDAGLALPGLDFRKVFVDIPSKRLAAMATWQRPFDAVDITLRPSDYGPDGELNRKMNSRLNRGHGWFGVGEWALACRYYLHALAPALAGNDLTGLEVIVRLVVDTYAAAGAPYEAASLTQEFTSSSYTPVARSRGFSVRRQTYESVVVAYALEGLWVEAEIWLRRIPNDLAVLCDPNIQRWNITQLLLDTYCFRQDSADIARLQQVVDGLSDLAER